MTAPPPHQILLTGGSGFVGTHLAAALRRRMPDSKVAAPRVDLTDPAAIEEMVRTTRPDVCVHLAAVSTVGAARDNEERAWTINVHGTLRLARAILRHSPDCSMLFASSAETYGATFRDGVPLRETATLAPVNTYGATKAAADLALGAMAEQGLRVLRLRPFNHAGAGQTTSFVVAAFARHVARIAAGLQPPVISVGNLDTCRDFVDVADVCAAYLACIERRDVLAAGTVMNLASGQPRRIGDILYDLLALADVQAEVRIDTALLRPNDLLVTRGDASLAGRLLDWQPTIAWSDTLGAVLSDMRQRVANGLP